MKKRKAEIIAQFREKMGLIVDQPLPGWKGNFNDGNTAHRLFADPKLSSTITGIDKYIIHRFGTLLRAISSGYPINTEAFESFAKETKRMYLQLYPWF